MGTALWGDLVPLPVTRSHGLRQGPGGCGSSRATRQHVPCSQEKAGKRFLFECSICHLFLLSVFFTYVLPISITV